MSAMTLSVFRSTIIDTIGTVGWSYLHEVMSGKAVEGKNEEGFEIRCLQ
ncbi:hypothetical protein M3J09_009622 [Ascochyta lentis]